MRKILITELSLRRLLRELMDSDTPIVSNPVVDPQAAETDPTNQNFVPSNKVELMSALRALINTVDDERVPQVYITAKDAIEKEEAEMKKNNVEETVRLIVRKLILESINEVEVKKIPLGVHGGEFSSRFDKAKKGLQKTFKAMRDEDDDYVSVDEPATGRARKNLMMSDVSGASFKEIAKELGFAAESGAKQAVEKALQKAKFVGTMDQDDLEILILQSMSDYVDMLQGSGDLDAQEVKLLKDNPSIIRDLDGFRDFLDKSIRKTRKNEEKE